MTTGKSKTSIMCSHIEYWSEFHEIACLLSTFKLSEQKMYIFLYIDL